MALAKKVLTAESSRWAAREGSPFPQGVSWIESERAFNFALYSKHAERVTLLLYDEHDLANAVVERRLDYLSHKSGRIWHCRVPLDSARDARYYAYSVDGPMPRGRIEWHTFDPAKVLLDPHARAIRAMAARGRHVPPRTRRHSRSRQRSAAVRIVVPHRGALGCRVGSLTSGDISRITALRDLW